jgi:tetratricopeptide (TPR) repeat protein
LDDYAAEVTYYDAKILVLLALNRYSEALELIDTALQDPHLSEFPERKMQLFVNRGNACFDENKTEQAFDAYSKALELSVRLQNWNVEARMLGRLGAVRAELGDFAAAIDYANQSLKKAKKAEDQRLVGEQYCMLALANRDLGNYAVAIEYGEKGLEVFNTATANPLKEKIRNLLEDLRTEAL